MPAITFHIPGKPFGKQRARATARGGFARMYTPAETVSFERQVGVIARQFFAEPITGPVRLTVTATFAPAPSWSKKKTAAHMGQHHTSKPDLDNIAKATKDALNRIAWGDDSQVAECLLVKRWGATAGTVVTVEGLACDLDGFVLQNKNGRQGAETPNRPDQNPTFTRGATNG